MNREFYTLVPVPANFIFSINNMVTLTTTTVSVACALTGEIEILLLKHLRARKCSEAEFGSMGRLHITGVTPTAQTVIGQLG